MFLLDSYATCNRRRGLTLVEVLIALALMSLLSIIVVQGMILHARMAKANLEMQRMAENSRRFADAVQTTALDATEVRIDAGPAGANTVLTISKPDPENLSAVITRQYAYLDADNNPATIADNTVVERDVNTPLATTGKIVLQYCSPVTGQSVFSADPNSGRALYHVNLRMGDTTYPANSADNAITGNGYQSYLVQTSFGTL